MPFTFVPVSGLDAIARARPVMSAWTSGFGDGDHNCAYLYCRETLHHDRSFHEIGRRRCWPPSTIASSRVGEAAPCMTRNRLPIAAIGSAVISKSGFVPHLPPVEAGVTDGIGKNMFKHLLAAKKRLNNGPFF